MNQRPLGYESSRGGAGNPLISRRLCRMPSKYAFLADTPTFLSFGDVSGWYGSKMGADALWVLPKPVPVPPTARRQPSRPSRIRTRAYGPPRASCTKLGIYVTLTQQPVSSLPLSKLREGRAREGGIPIHVQIRSGSSGPPCRYPVETDNNRRPVPFRLVNEFIRGSLSPGRNTGNSRYLG